MNTVLMKIKKSDFLEEVTFTRDKAITKVLRERTQTKKQFWNTRTKSLENFSIRKMKDIAIFKHTNPIDKLKELDSNSSIDENLTERSQKCETKREIKELSPQ